jgi:hypothetical protein
VGKNLFAEAESAQWLCLGVRFPLDKIVFNVSAEFIAKQSVRASSPPSRA